MSDAAVGSISHILKTAFKDVYNEPAKREDAIVKRALRAEEDAAAEADVTAAAEGGTEDGQAEEKQQQIEKTSKEDIYLPPLERLTVADNLKSYLTDEQSKIDSELVVLNENAGELAAYLRQQRETALELEQAEEEELKKQGVMLGQHIPSLPSKLSLDPHRLAQYGRYSNNLVVARDLVDDNKTNTLRRTGNMPISELAEQKKAERSKKAATVVANVPHYQFQTGNATVRKERINSRFAAITRARQLEEEERLIKMQESGTTPLPRKHFPNTKRLLSGAQRIANQEILRGMNHKLNYLRNPRNIPQSINRLITRNEASIANNFEQNEGHEMPSETSSPGRTTANASHGHETEAASKRSKFAEFPKVTVPLFASDPPVLSFNEYEVGREYTVPVAFRNVSSVSRMVRVLPPATPFFSMSSLVYPKNSKAGLCASGMSATAVLSFFPHSLGDYEDSLEVETEGGSFTVPIIAKREAPQLSLPPTLNLGACLVGDAMRVSVNCLNSGGSGSFRLIRAEDYPNIPMDLDWETMGCYRMQPFTVYPVEFTLQKGDAVDINIEFLPLAVGDVEQSFYLMCDNTQVFSYTLRATAKVLKLSVIEVNGAPFDASDMGIRRDLFFEAANIGIEQMQQIIVVNDTGIPVEYEWVMVDASTREKDLHKAGQNNIKEREHQERKRQALESRASNNQDSASKTSRSKKPNTAVRNGFEALPESKPSTSPGFPGSPSSPSTRPGTENDILYTLSPMNALLETLEESDGPRNSVIEKEFEISPARGLMPCDGAEPFSFSFTPTGLSIATQRAVLMIRSVPMASLPGPGQDSLLSQLQHHGHGSQVRLLSWLDEMGSPARVEKYYKPNGVSSTVAQLNNLQSVIGLVMGHANGLVDPEEIWHVERVVRCVLKHVEKWINDEMDEEDLRQSGADDGSSSYADTIVRLGMYRWSGDAAAEPDVIPPLNLTKALRNLPSQPDEIQPQQYQPQPESADEPFGEEKSPSNFGEPRPETTGSRGVTFASPNEPDLFVQMQQFTAEERHMLSFVYIDSDTALTVVGSAIGEVLDDKVKHEAVDFVRDRARLHVACLFLDASGEGKPQEIRLSPPLLHVTGQLPVGLTWTGQVTLSNPSSAMAEIEVCAELIKVFGVPAPAPKGGVLPPLPPASAGSGQAPARPNSRDGFNFDSVPDVEVPPPAGEALQSLSAAGSASGVVDMPKLLSNSASASGKPESLVMPPIDTSLFSLHFEPVRVLLLPESESTIDVTVTVFTCGLYNIVVPCRATTSEARVDSLTIALNCVGPRLRFSSPEVDLGLIGVRSSSETAFTFTNDSDSPATFSITPIVDVDPEQLKLEQELGLSSPTPVAGTARGSASARGMPNNSSGMLGASESEMLEPNSAAVMVSPPQGTAQPGETVKITLACRSGKIPQRLRGRLECRVFDAMGAAEQRMQLQTFRGEIQAPKTIVYPMSVDLGVVFVGMPVTFQITTENICNLPTNYKLSRPGGDSPLFSIDFDKPSGPLGAKEKVVITCRFVATMAGKVDDLIANKIFGVLNPLGFSIKAIARPLQVDFPLLPPGTSLPMPLAPPTMTQLPGAAAPPEPTPIEPLDFTESVPLYERRILRFAIRNLSAISASFELQVKKYSVLENITSESLSEVQMARETAVAAKTAAPGKSRASRNGTAGQDVEESTKPLLKAHEAGVHKFHSVDGKKHAGTAVERQENRLFLTSGLGASYLVEPATGLLQPWGVQVVTVRTFNDMPAGYDDELQVILADSNKSSKRSIIPLKMTVLGCPMVIENGTLGMTTIPRDKSVPLEVWQRSSPPQLLQLGVSCVHGEPMRRVFSVRNNGSMAGKISWKVRANMGKVNGPIKVGLSVLGDGRVKSIFNFWSDIAKDASFKVEPESATIRPYASQSFSVTLFRTDRAGFEEASLIGNVFFDPQGTTGLALNPSGASLETSALASQSHLSIATPSIASTLIPQESSRDKSYRLTLQLQGSLITPSIAIDKRVLTAQAEGVTLVPEQQGIKFKTAATALFERKARGPGPGCSKALPLVNPTDSAMVLSVSTQGPFILALEGDDAGAPKGPSSSKTINSSSAATLMSQTAPPSLSSNTKMRTAFGSDTIGKTVTLLPGGAANFQLSFNPTRSLRETLKQTQKPDAGPVPDEKGLLILSFSTGQRIHLPIVAQIAAPFLAGSSASLYFGTVNVGMQTDGVLLLSNPTAVSARWTVAAVPGGGASTRASAIKVPGYTVPEPEIDDPSVFIITPSAGEVEGPTVSVEAATAALPKDLNRREDLIPVVPQRLSETSWSTSTLSFRDTIAQRHQHQHQSASDACYPQPIKIIFNPDKSCKYSSRFRFTCEYGNTFDVLLQGHGTFDEHLHAPLRPEPN